MFRYWHNEVKVRVTLQFKKEAQKVSKVVKFT